MIPHLPAMHAHPSIIATIGKSCIPLMLLGIAWAGHGGNSPSPAPDAASKTEVSRDTEHFSEQKKSNLTIWLKQQYGNCKHYMFEPINPQMQEWRVCPESSPDGHQARFILKLSDESYCVSPLMGELQRIMQRQRREEAGLEELRKTAESFRSLNLIVLIFAATVHFILLLYLICKILEKKRQENPAPLAEAENSRHAEPAAPLTVVQPAPLSPSCPTPRKPTAPDVNPPSDGHPEILVPLPTPPEESWKDFCGMPLPKELETPFPGFWKAPLEASVNSSEMSLTDEGSAVGKMLPRRWKEYREPSVQEAIARHFITWAEKQPDGRSLLLEADKDCCYWFVGDIHGGFCALMRILTFVCQSIRADDMRKRHTLILLGDYIDRGNEDFAVLAIVEELLMASASGASLPFSVVALRGNHDTGLSRRDDGLFDSTVKPAETAAELNAMMREGEADVALSLGKAAMELARISPCMGELTNLSPTKPGATLLFTHGGLPHTDLQQEAYEKLPASDIRGELTPALPAEFRTAWEEDFTWIRLVEKAPIKIPNRGSHGCDMGTNDVNTYRRLHRRLTGRSITFIIRGHDHEEGGYKLYSYHPQENNTARNGVQRNCGVLTINALDITELEKSAETGHPCAGNAIVACWSRGQDISLFRIPLADGAEKQP